MTEPAVVHNVRHRNDTLIEYSNQHELWAKAAANRADGLLTVAAAAATAATDSGAKLYSDTDRILR